MAIKMTKFDNAILTIAGAIIAADEHATALREAIRDAIPVAFPPKRTSQQHNEAVLAIATLYQDARPGIAKESARRFVNRQLADFGIEKPASASPEAVRKAEQRAAAKAAKAGQTDASPKVPETSAADVADAGADVVPTGADRVIKAMTGNPDVIPVLEWALANLGAVRAIMPGAKQTKPRPNPADLSSVYQTGTAH